jgi:hypothetical protein
MQKYTCVDHVMHRNNVPTINYHSAHCALLLKALCVRTKEVRRGEVEHVSAGQVRASISGQFKNYRNIYKRRHSYIL